MRAKQITIPSTFLKFDTHVTDPDECVNVRDVSTFRQNHNSLLAERVRKDLVCQASPTSRNATAAYPVRNHVYFKSTFYPDESPHSCLMSIPLFLTPLTQELHFWFRACQGALDAESTLDEDPELYIVVHEPQLPYMGEDITVNSITITAPNDTPTTYHLTVPVPPWSGENLDHFGKWAYIADIRCLTPIDDSRVDVGPVALVDVGPDWFVVATSSIGIHDLVYTSMTRAEPRVTVAARSLGGGNYKYFIDAPWSDIPTPGTHTISSHQILQIDLYSFGVQEMEITDPSGDFAL